MKSQKRPAIKRIRKPEGDKSALPLILGIAGGVIVLVTLALVLIFVVFGKKESDSTSVPNASESGKEVQEGKDKVKTESEENDSVNKENDSTNKEVPSSENVKDTTETDKDAVEETDKDAATETDVKNVEETPAPASIEVDFEKEIATYLKGKTLENRIDQLFMLNPIKWVNENVESEDQKISEHIEKVGPKAQAACTSMQLAGLVVANELIGDADDGGAEVLLQELENLSEQAIGMPMYFYLTDAGKEMFANEGVLGKLEKLPEDICTEPIYYYVGENATESEGTEENVAENEVSSQGDAETETVNSQALKVKIFEASANVEGENAEEGNAEAVNTEVVNAESVIAAWTEGYDILVIRQDDFSYKQLREELKQKIESDADLLKLFDSKLRKVLKEKMKTHQSKNAASAEESSNSEADVSEEGTDALAEETKISTEGTDTSAEAGSDFVEEGNGSTENVEESTSEVVPQEA